MNACPFFFTHPWHTAGTKDALEHGDAASDDDGVSDCLHDGSCLPGHQGQEDRGLVQTPEQKQLPCRDTAGRHRPQTIHRPHTDHTQTTHRPAPATRARRTGALYRLQNRNSSPAETQPAVTDHRPHRPYTYHRQTTHRPYTDHTQTIYTKHTQTTDRPYTDYVYTDHTQTTHRPQTDHTDDATLICSRNAPVQPPPSPLSAALTSAGCGASDVSEQVGVGVPEHAVEAEHHLVEVAEAEPVDDGLFPLGQGRVEPGAVDAAGRGQGVLQHAQREGAEDGVRWNRAGHVTVLRSQPRGEALSTASSERMI